MLRILHVGHGYLPYRGGGMVFHQIDLMRTLTGLGYQVGYFTSTRHNWLPFSYIQKRRVDGLLYFDLLNSPNIAATRGDPVAQCQEPIIEIKTKQVLDDFLPNIVHIHDLQGHCASIIQIIKERNIPIIKTMHNYWDFCPQIELLDINGKVCTNFQNGVKCAECKKLPLSNKGKRLRQKIIGTIGRTALYPHAKRIWFYIKRWDSNLKFSTQTHSQKPPSFTAYQYAYRRDFFVKQLNLVDVIHCYSPRSGEIFRNFGVDEKRIKVIFVSTKAIDFIKQKTLREINYPVVFGYRGLLGYHKGVHVLIEAFSKINQDKAKLVIFGEGQKDYKNMLYKKSEGLNVEFRGSYSQANLHEVNQEIDVGMMPSIWEDVCPIVGMEYIKARTPIIGSRIGGIQDLVQNGLTGFLFEPRNPEDLANKMINFIDNPSLIREMQKKINPWRSIDDYAEEMVTIYKSLPAKEKLRL